MPLTKVRFGCRRHSQQVVRTYNADPEVNGILVQLPLPAHIDEEKVLGAVRPSFCSLRPTSPRVDAAAAHQRSPLRLLPPTLPRALTVRPRVAGVLYGSARSRALRFGWNTQRVAQRGGGCRSTTRRTWTAFTRSTWASWRSAAATPCTWRARPRAASSSSSARAWRLRAKVRW